MVYAISEFVCEKKKIKDYIHEKIIEKIWFLLLFSFNTLFFQDTAKSILNSIEPIIMNTRKKIQVFQWMCLEVLSLYIQWFCEKTETEKMLFKEYKTVKTCQKNLPLF